MPSPDQSVPLSSDYAQYPSLSQDSPEHSPGPLIPLSSNYAPYPSLSPDDLGPLPDPFTYLQSEAEPMTPPPTPITTDSASMIDRAFAAALPQGRRPEYFASDVAEAFAGADNKARAWIPKGDMVLFCLVIFILGVLFGVFAI